MTMEEAIQQLDGAEMMLLNREFIQFNQAIIMAISALRTQQKQENECAKCSGIVYRQTDSGKIIQLVNGVAQKLHLPATCRMEMDVLIKSMETTTMSQ